MGKVSLNSPQDIAKARKKIEADGEKVTRLLSEVQASLRQLFLHESGTRTMHKRYIGQRQKNVWEKIEVVGTLLDEYRERQTLRTLLKTILHVIAITRGIPKDGIEEGEICGKVDTMLQNGGTGNSSTAPVLIALLEELGVAIAGIERFLSRGTQRNLEKDRV